MTPRYILGDLEKTFANLAVQKTTLNRETIGFSVIDKYHITTTPSTQIRPPQPRPKCGVRNPAAQWRGNDI
jgi:hypothetical protein